MRAVVQRVSEASVEVEDGVCGAIGTGLLVYIGIASADSDADVSYITDKIRHLRIFADDSDRLNLDVIQARGQVLVVSAFTVLADARRGRRPSFEAAASPERAIVLYELLCDALTALDVPVQRGRFQAAMNVRSINSGPICILLDSRRDF